MTIHETSGENHQCCYFALLGALQHLGKARGMDHLALKNRILDYMYAHRRTPNHFVHARFSIVENLENIMRGEQIGFKLGGSHTEDFTTMERWREVVWQFCCASALLALHCLAGHVATYDHGYRHGNHGRGCFVWRARHRVLPQFWSTFCLHWPPGTPLHLYTQQ